MSLLDLIQVSRAVSGQPGHWEAAFARPRVVKGASLSVFCTNQLAAGEGCIGN